MTDLAAAALRALGDAATKAFDVESFRATHKPKRVQTGSVTHGGPPQYGEWCRDCDRPWPCDATKALDRVEAQGREIERLRDELDFAATAALDHMDCVECEDDNTRLRNILLALRPSVSAPTSPDGEG